MKRLLAVKAHPLTSEESLSIKGFEKFLEVYREENPSNVVEVLDLYDIDLPELDKDILSAWNALRGGKDFADLSVAQQEKVTAHSRFTEQFLQADHVVIANPLWNSLFPPRLKTWFDTVMVAGKTFKYTEEGMVSLADGKKLLHLQANGGIFEESDASSQFVKLLFESIGVEVKHIAIEGADFDPSKREELIDGFMENVSKAAKGF